MNAADRKYRDDFLARGFRKGHRVMTRNCGPGTIVRIGGNCAFVACDQDEPGSERVILFENISRLAPADIDARTEAYWADRP